MTCKQQERKGKVGRGSTNIQIRRAKTSDLDQLKALWLAQRAYHLQFDPLYEPSASSGQTWAAQITPALVAYGQPSSARPAEVIYVVVTACDMVLGYVHGGIYPWVLSPHQWYGSLNTISLAPSARGHGLGKRLCEALLTWVQKQGIAYISLHVDYRNQRALKLYESLGFQAYQHRLMLQLSAKKLEEAVSTD